MKRSAWWFFTALCILFSSAAQAQQFRVLLFTKTDGFHHKSINAGVSAMQQMAEKHYFDLDWEENPAKLFTDDGLARYDVILFLSTTGDVLNKEQQAAMERFIQSGKGFVGVHSASDTEYDWDWYTQMVGRNFHSHPANQTARLMVKDRQFPGLERWPDSLWWTDEWYEFSAEHSANMRYLLAVDDRSYDRGGKRGVPAGDGSEQFHPIAWYQHYDGGRAFYTALGHLPATFSDTLFLEHIYGGVFWAATGRGLNIR